MVLFGSHLFGSVWLAFRGPFRAGKTCVCRGVVDQKYLNGVLYDHIRGEMDGVLGSCTQIGACCRLISLILALRYWKLYSYTDTHAHGWR